jgi:hypothetical protein
MFGLCLLMRLGFNFHHINWSSSRALLCSSASPAGSRAAFSCSDATRFFMSPVWCCCAAVPLLLSGFSLQSLSALLQLQVRPCLPGQEAVLVNLSSSSSSALQPSAAGFSSSMLSVSCRMCGAPSFSFTAYPNPSYTTTTTTSSSSSSDLAILAAAAAAGDPDRSEVCQRCPQNGICIGGMVIPAQGCYQPHPRSAAIRPCPHVAACTRDADAMLNLQGVQCAERRAVKAEDVDSKPFELLQCSRGYAGEAAVACIVWCLSCAVSVGCGCLYCLAAAGILNLLGEPCAEQRAVMAEDVDSKPFDLLQCSRGYAGEATSPDLGPMLTHNVVALLSVAVSGRADSIAYNLIHFTCPPVYFALRTY